VTRLFQCYAECHYAECRYAECRYAECRYTECHGAGLQGQIVVMNLVKLCCAA
jgi:hypothetical protein